MTNYLLALDKAEHDARVSKRIRIVSMDANELYHIDAVKPTDNMLCAIVSPCGCTDEYFSSDEFTTDYCSEHKRIA